MDLIQLNEKVKISQFLEEHENEVRLKKNRYCMASGMAVGIKINGRACFSAIPQCVHCVLCLPVCVCVVRICSAFVRCAAQRVQHKIPSNGSLNYTRIFFQINECFIYYHYYIFFCPSRRVR